MGLLYDFRQNVFGNSTLRSIGLISTYLTFHIPGGIFDNIQCMSLKRSLKAQQLREALCILPTKNDCQLRKVSSTAWKNEMNFPKITMLTSSAFNRNFDLWEI